MTRLIGGVAVVVAALLSFSEASQAALMNCPGTFTTDGTAKVTDTTGNFTAASSCEYLTPPDSSNTAKLVNINSAGFFGFSDWQDNGDTQITAEALSGSWSISGVDFATYDYAIFFKDGSDTNLIGFLFNELYSFGEWLSPFTNPPFDIKETKEVSHYSIFRRMGDPPPLPEPGSLGLLGLGLIGLGLLVRRRRTHATVN